MKCNKSDLSAAPTKLNPALIKANINDSGKDRRWAYSSNRKKNYKKLIRRWDSERELPLQRQVLQNIHVIDSCINSATDRRGYVLERMFTKFSEITR